jgi:hypothetical protein
MSSELQKQIEKAFSNKETRDKIMQIVDLVGKGFPYLSCPSKDDCDSFKWYIK